MKRLLGLLLAVMVLLAWLGVKWFHTSRPWILIAAAFVLGLGLLLLKILTMDLERSRQERLIRRLAQRLAMLEARGPLPESVEPAEPAEPAAEARDRESPSDAAEQR